MQSQQPDPDSDVERPLAENDPRLKKRYYTEMTLTRRILTPLVKGIFVLAADMQVLGAEKLPRSGPVILACNHIGNYDALTIQFVLPRPIFFMGKEELFRNPLLEPIFRRLGGFPVFRGQGDEWAVQHSLKVLAARQALGIFPEGRRNYGQGLRIAKTGTARLAITSGAPIVPTALLGAEKLFRGLPKRALVRVVLGAPIYPRPGDLPLELTDRMMFAIAAMLPPEQRGAYAVKPKGF
jgi:1-acyl-sn-glycerol-3-phosphate acyltransferase